MTTSHDLPPLMTPRAAAAAVGRAERTLRLWVAQKRLTLYRDSTGRRFYSADEVRRLAPKPVTAVTREGAV